MNRSLLAVGCIIALHVSVAHAQPAAFLGKSAEAWRDDLTRSDASIRRSAAFALGRLGWQSREAVPDLVRLMRDKDDKVRDMAAAAVGDIARSLKSDNTDVWRHSGVMLVKLLKEDPSERVRRSAAYALGAFGPQAGGVTEDLMKALSDAKPSVRQNAAWALGQIGAPAAEAVPKLCAALRDKDVLVRRDAAGALGSMGKAGERAGTPLIELLKAETDNVVKKTALNSLAHVAGPQQVDAAKDLEPLLEDKDPEVSLNAALVLGRIGGEQAASALKVLRTALKSSDAHIQELVTAALANLGPNAKGAMYDLADTLTNDNNSITVRRNAALAIAHIGASAKPVVPSLVKALNRLQPTEVRQFAAEALAQIKYPANEAAVPAILDAIQNDPDALVRQKCVWSLFAVNSTAKFRELGADKALEKLLNERGEETALLRYDAARKLANILEDEAPDKTIDVLLDMLTNTSLKVYNRTDATVEGANTESTVGRSNVAANLGGDARYMAVEALGWMGKKAAKRSDVVAALKKAAEDKDLKLRETAKKALAELNIKD